MKISECNTEKIKKRQKAYFLYKILRYFFCVIGLFGQCDKSRIYNMASFGQTKFCIRLKFVIFFKFNEFKMGKTNDDFEGIKPYSPPAPAESQTAAPRSQ